MAGSVITKVFKNRLIMRAPIGLYRMGLGFLFGHRLMMLEHVGRTSGEPRFVVLEVVTMPGKNEVVIASAFGRGAQWFQNLVAQPQCYVSIGLRRRVPAVAAILEPGAAKEFLAEYQSEHPAVWKRLESLMVELHDGDADFELPLARLTLQPKSAVA